MSITKQTPKTIFLGGSRVEVGDIAAGEVLTPGQLIELYNSSGTLLYRKHAATGALAQGKTYCTEQSMLNKGVDDTIPIGDLVEASIMTPGANVWALIASGQNITQGGYLESAGDGTLKAFSSGAKIAQALETKASVTVQTRIRVEIV